MATCERCIGLERQVKHWQSNCINLTERNALLRDRPDLPVDRTAAYRTLVALQDKVAALELRLEALGEL